MSSIDHTSLAFGSLGLATSDRVRTLAAQQMKGLRMKCATGNTLEPRTGRQWGPSQLKTAKSGRFLVGNMLMFAWILIVGVVGWVSLTPGFGATAEYHIDKILHLCVYLVLGALPGFALPRPSWAALAGLLLALIGVALEVGQSAIPGRVGSVGDAAANVVGASLGVTMAVLLRQRLRSRA